MKRAKKRVGLRICEPVFVMFFHTRITADELRYPAEPLPNGVKLCDGHLVKMQGIRIEPSIGTPERVEWQDAENRRARAMLDVVGRRKAPWPDYRGADIHEGDTIVHPQGDCGTVVFDASREPGLEWRVQYLSGEESLWLGNQIGDKGQACVLATKEPGNG